MKGYIYKIENKINKKKYIGQTVRSVKTRFREHINAKDDYPIHLALRKYGKENFSFDIIEEIEIESEDELYKALNKLETKYIQEYKSLAPNGYNIASGGENTKRIPHIDKNLIFDNEESIINIETGEVYNTVYEWLIYNRFPLNEQYTLYDGKPEYKFRFMHPEHITFARGTVFPPNSNLKDILEGKAKKYTPIGDPYPGHLKVPGKLLWKNKRLATEYYFNKWGIDVLEKLNNLYEQKNKCLKLGEEINRLKTFDESDKQILKESEEELKVLKDKISESIKSEESDWNYIQKCLSDIVVTTHFTPDNIIDLLKEREWIDEDIWEMLNYGRWDPDIYYDIESEEE